MKKFISSSMKVMSCMAIMLTALTVNSCCLFICHQPKMPKAAERFKK